MEEGHHRTELEAGEVLQKSRQVGEEGEVRPLQEQAAAAEPMRQVAQEAGGAGGLQAHQNWHPVQEGEAGGPKGQSDLAEAEVEALQECPIPAQAGEK